MLSSITFNSSQVAGTVLLGLCAIAGIIFFARRHFDLKSGENLTSKYRGKQWSSPLAARNKYPDVNIFKWQPVFFKLGLVFALGTSLGVFNITTRTQNVQSDLYQFSIDEDVEIDVPRSQETPPPPPPPPPPAVQEVAVVDILDENEEISFVDQSVDANSAVQAPVPVTRERAVPPPPPPPPSREEDVKEIFVVVEDMPRFPGCEDLPGDNKAKKACSDKKLMDFIYANIHYPAVAKENGVEPHIPQSWLWGLDVK